MNPMTLNRQGTAKFRTKGKYHCGTNKEQSVKWTARVEVPDPSMFLDAKNFLFDHALFLKYWEKVTVVEESCEFLAIEFADYIYHAVRAENIKFVGQRFSIEVILQPEPYSAFVKYTLNA